MPGAVLGGTDAGGYRDLGSLRPWIFQAPERWRGTPSAPGVDVPLNAGRKRMRDVRRQFDSRIAAFGRWRRR